MIMISSIIVACKSIRAQSIETLTVQSKVASPQIKVGGDVAAIAINEDTNKIYTFNPTNVTVSIISNSGGMVKNVHIGKHTLEVPPFLTPFGSNPMAADWWDQCSSIL
jgi:hypothetical protein